MEQDIYSVYLNVPHINRLCSDLVGSLRELTKWHPVWAGGHLAVSRQSPQDDLLGISIKRAHFTHPRVLWEYFKISLNNCDYLIVTGILEWNTYDPSGDGSVLFKHFSVA